VHLELSVWIGAAPTGPKPSPKKQGTPKASGATEEQQIIDDDSNAKGNVASPEHQAQRVPKRAASEAREVSDEEEEPGVYGAWNHPINQPNALNKNISRSLTRSSTPAQPKT
jgi:hypothetical protein